MPTFKTWVSGFAVPPLNGAIQTNSSTEFCKCTYRILLAMCKAFSVLVQRRPTSKRKNERTGYVMLAAMWSQEFQYFDRWNARNLYILKTQGLVESKNRAVYARMEAVLLVEQRFDKGCRYPATNYSFSTHIFARLGCTISVNSACAWAFLEFKYTRQQFRMMYIQFHPKCSENREECCIRNFMTGVIFASICKQRAQPIHNCPKAAWIQSPLTSMKHFDLFPAACLLGRFITEVQLPLPDAGSGSQFIGFLRNHYSKLTGAIPLKKW